MREKDLPYSQSRSRGVRGDTRPRPGVPTALGDGGALPTASDASDLEGAGFRV